MSKKPTRKKKVSYQPWDFIKDESRRELDLTRVKQVLGKYGTFRKKPKDNWSRYTENGEHHVFVTLLTDGRIVMYSTTYEAGAAKDLLNGGIEKYGDYRCVFENEIAFMDYIYSQLEHYTQYLRWQSGE